MIVFGLLSHGLANLLARIAEERARPLGEAPTLFELLGRPGANQPYWERHILGRAVVRRPDLFGSEFLGQAGKNIRVRLGWRFGAGFEEMNPGRTRGAEALSSDQAAFVITVPVFFSGLLTGVRPEAPGWRRTLYDAQARAAAGSLDRVLGRYARETRRLAREGAELEGAVAPQDYAGDRMIRLSSGRLAGFGGRLTQREFYRPDRGARVGITGVQIQSLLEICRQALAGRSSGLWLVLQPRWSALLDEGQVPSSEKLVQALRETDPDAIRDDLLKRAVLNLRSDLDRAEASGDAEALAVAVNQTVALILHSRQGFPVSALLQAPTEARAGPGPSRVRLLVDPAQRAFLSETVDRMSRAAATGAPEVRSLLGLIGRALQEDSGGALDPRTGVQLLAGLQAVSPAGVMAVPLGEDVTVWNGGMVNGRVEVKRLRSGEQDVEVAKPVVANVLAREARTIEDLAAGRAGQGELWVLPYTGRLTRPLPATGRFARDVAGRLQDSEIFRDQLRPSQALAQAYYRWYGRKSPENAARLARVPIRLLRRAANDLSANGRPEAEVGYGRALLSVNALFGTSPVFRRRSTRLGTCLRAEPPGPLEVMAPADLRPGAVLAWAALWSRLPQTGFALDDRWEERLQRSRLRNFRISSAA